MSIWKQLRVTLARTWVRHILLTLLAFGVGWVLAVLLIPPPQVGVIHFQDVIWYGSADWLEAQFRYAIETPSIRAVVVVIDSPGGEAAASERLYFDLLRLRTHKPVVVMISGMAASGGYYMAAASDAIYSTPSSDVGNIGVISMLPKDSFVEEEYLFTGPFKAFGSPRDSYVRQMEVLKESFLEAVFAQRGAILAEKETTRTTLSRGEVYVGTLAMQLGLVDGLGSRDDAIAHAARLAKIGHYDVLNITEEMSRTGQLPPLYGPITPETLPQRLRTGTWGSYPFLYLAPQLSSAYLRPAKGGE